MKYIFDNINGCVVRCKNPKKNNSNNISNTLTYTNNTLTYTTDSEICKCTTGACVWTIKAMPKNDYGWLFTVSLVNVNSMPRKEWFLQKIKDCLTNINYITVEGMDIYQDAKPVVSSASDPYTIVISVYSINFTGDLGNGIVFVPFQSPPKPQRTSISPVYSKSTARKNQICGSDWDGWLN